MPASSAYSAAMALRRARLWPATVLVCACLWLLAGWPAVAAADDPHARLEAIEADLEQLEQRLRAAHQDRAALDVELERSDRALADLASDVRATEAQIRASSAELATLEAEQETLQARQEATLEALRAELRQGWLLARRGPLQTVLEADAPDRVARLLVFHEYLARARLEAQAEHRAAARALTAAAAAVAATRDTLLTQRDLLERQVAGLQRVREERQRVLAELDAELAEGADTRTALEAERDDLRTLIERLDVDRFDGTGESFVANRGQLPWPVSDAGLRGSPKADGRTGGVLLPAEPGSTVRAIHTGRVVFADWMRGFGLLVILDHGGGYMSLYGQAETLLRNVGDVVEAGESLATTGRSGGSRESGVWFGIRKDGSQEPPDRWCAPI